LSLAFSIAESLQLVALVLSFPFMAIFIRWDERYKRVPVIPLLVFIAANIAFFALTFSIFGLAAAVIVMGILLLLKVQTADFAIVFLALNLPLEVLVALLIYMLLLKHDKSEIPFYSRFGIIFSIVSALILAISFV